MLTIPVCPGESALTAALADLPAEGTLIRLLLAPGIYREKVTLARADTILEGAGAEQTSIIWGDAATDVMPDGTSRGTFRTATLMVDAPRVTLRGLTIANDASPREKAGQAIALYADGDFFLCEDCILRGHQDTLFTAPLPPKEMQKNGFIGPKQFALRTPQRQTYRRCRIEGDIDFIFGSAAAWFEECAIISVDGRADRTAPCAGYATAASTPEGQRFGYVFNRCRFLGENIAAGAAYLGRPWREYAQTVLLHCELGPHIHPAGWHDWEKSAFHQKGFYAEYACFGPGAEGQRAGFAHQLTEEETEGFSYEAFLKSLSSF